MARKSGLDPDLETVQDSAECTMKAGSKKHGVDLDDILVKEVGQFGRYQVVTLLLAMLPSFFAAFGSGEYIFTTARIPTRCLIEQCESDNPEFAPPWVLNAINGSSVSSFDSCLRYPNATIQLVVEPGTCPAYLFDHSNTIGCDQYVYENTDTVVYDFNLGCDEWRRSQIGSIRTIGVLVSLPITGYISDRWGRRVALVFNAFNTSWAGLARSFVGSYEWFLALEVIEAAIGAAAYSSCHILVTELVGPKWRVTVAATLTTYYAVGQVMLGLIAWGVPSWRSLTQVLYAPQLLIVFYFWILPESVRWLMSKDRYEKSEAILKNVAKINNKELSQDSLRALRANADARKKEPSSKESWLPLLVFKSKIVLLRCIVAPVWWMTYSLVYFGMNINAVNLTGNQYLNYVYVAAVGIPASWISIHLLDRVGRKPVLQSAFFICAACQFSFAFISEEVAMLRLALYLIGKFAICIVMTSVYLYSAELFPTRHRHSLVAFAAMVGRLGGIIAPLTPALAQEVWAPFPQVLFGSFALVSGLLVFTTPETLGTKLPDTMEEAEQLGRRNH